MSRFSAVPDNANSEQPYRFTTIEALIADFLRDVRRARGEGE
jgi:hypothetical protein